VRVQQAERNRVTRAPIDQSETNSSLKNIYEHYRDISVRVKVAPLGEITTCHMAVKMSAKRVNAPACKLAFMPPFNAATRFDKPIGHSCTQHRFYFMNRAGGDFEWEAVKKKSVFHRGDVTEAPLRGQRLQTRAISLPESPVIVFAVNALFNCKPEVAVKRVRRGKLRENTDNAAR